MTFKTIYPNFNTFKHKINIYFNDSVKDTDINFFNLIYGIYQNREFLAKDDNINQSQTVKIWLDLKTKWIKLLQEQQKDLTALFIKEISQDYYTGDSSQLTENTKKYFLNGGSNKFKPSIINLIGSYLSLPEFYTLLVDNFKELFTPINMNKELDSNILGIEEIKQEVLQALGIENLEKRTIAIHSITKNMLSPEIIKLLNAKNTIDLAPIEVKIAKNLADILTIYGDMDKLKIEDDRILNSANLAHPIIYQNKAAIENFQVPDGSITTEKIKDNAITSTKIGIEEIYGHHMRNYAITHRKLGLALQHALRLYKNIQSQEILLVAEYKNKVWNIIESAKEFNKIIYQINPTVSVLILDFSRPLELGEYFMKFRGLSKKDYQFQFINQDTNNLEVEGDYQYYYYSGDGVDRNLAVNVKSYGGLKPYLLRASSADYDAADLRSEVRIINNGNEISIASYTKDFGRRSERRTYDLQANIYHVSRENIVNDKSPHLKFSITNNAEDEEPEFKDKTFIIFGRTVSK